MGEYISREAARNAIRESKCPFAEDYALDVTAWYVSEVDAVPAADVVPVVRCKDCDCAPGGCDDEGYAYCIRCCEVVPPGHYCGYGARMDKEA